MIYNKGKSVPSLETNLLWMIIKAEGVWSADRVFSMKAGNGKYDSEKASNYVSDKAYNFCSVTGGGSSSISVTGSGINDSKGIKDSKSLKDTNSLKDRKSLKGGYVSYFKIYTLLATILDILTWFTLIA
jgi:hypothetical protein